MKKIPKKSVVSIGFVNDPNERQYSRPIACANCFVTLRVICRKGVRFNPAEVLDALCPNCDCLITDTVRL